VIRIRIAGPRANQLADFLAKVMDCCPNDLKSGAIVTVTESGVPVPHLPLFRL
jgi:hypothetical protein